jgi:hypothetical protein
MALGYGLDDWGSKFRFPAGAGNFSLHHRVQNGSGFHPASYPMGTRGSFPGVKRPGREDDHSLPSSAEVKNAWAIPPLSQCVFMAWCLVKHRDNFAFTFTSMEHWSVGILPQHYTASQPRRPRLESSPPWKPHITKFHPLLASSTRVSCCCFGVVCTVFWLAFRCLIFYIGLWIWSV